MVQIVVILLVSFIVEPLISLCLSERIKTLMLIVVYAVAFLWVVYTLFTGKLVQ